MLTLPSFLLRAAYCLVLLGYILPVVLSTLSTWSQLAAGRWKFAAVSVVLALMTAVLAAVRIVLVVRDPAALCTPPMSRMASCVRQLGIVLICVGLLATVLEWVAGPLMRSYMTTRSESGVELFVVAVILGMVKLTGTSGVILFEFSRLSGFETLASNHLKRQA